MHLRQWYIWTCVDNWLSSIFYVSLTGIARWLAIDGKGNVRMFDPSTIYDRTDDPVNGDVAITSTIRTSWLNLGDKNMRKTMNEVEIETATPAATVTIEGATSNADYSNPHTVVNASNLTLSPFGQYKVFTGGANAIDRQYRITISSTSNGSSQPVETVLGAYSFEVLPVNKL